MFQFESREQCPICRNNHFLDYEYGRREDGIAGVTLHCASCRREWYFPVSPLTRFFSPFRHQTGPGPIVKN